MRILLTGGTGLIGRALCQHLQQQGHELWVWSRQPARVPGLCSGARGVAHLQELNAVGPFDAVINLAGAPIADRPWTKSRRALLWQSRIDLTHKLVAWMAEQPTPPRVLLSASAVGWYGDRADACLDESSSPGGQDFGSRLCMAWEEEAQRAAHAGTRVALLRIAPVLASRGGMLARLLLPFKLGLGGRLGSGAQWMPWIHIEDLARLFPLAIASKRQRRLQRLRARVAAQRGIYPHLSAYAAPPCANACARLGAALGAGRNVHLALGRPTPRAAPHPSERFCLSLSHTRCGLGRLVEQKINTRQAQGLCVNAGLQNRREC